MSKPNDPGFNLKTANLLGEESSKVPEEPEAYNPPEPEYEPPPVDSAKQIREQMIAGENRVERRDLVMYIHSYYNSKRFGPYLKKNGFVQELETCTLEEMTILLDNIKVFVQNKNGSELVQKVVPQLIAASEPIVSQFYDVKGLSGHLGSSETFKDLLEEFALENQVFTNTKASTRLCLEIVKTAYFVHEFNAFNNAHKPAEKQAELSAEHKDLAQ